jgi:hypothetical protein
LQLASGTDALQANATVCQILAAITDLARRDLRRLDERHVRRAYVTIHRSLLGLVETRHIAGSIWTILVVTRKCAHVTEYAVLALLLWRALRSVPTLHTKRLLVFGAALLGCALFAASDEFHQTFVKSRTPSVRDVLLDTGGALLGLLIGASFARRRSKKFGTTTHTQFVDAKL